MSKCKLCGENKELFKANVCEGCYEEVTRNLKTRKSRLRELAELVKNSDNDQKQLILTEKNEIISFVNKYINKGILIRKNDYANLANEIEKYCLDSLKHKSSGTHTIFLPAAILALIFVLAEVVFGFSVVIIMVTCILCGALFFFYSAIDKINQLLDGQRRTIDLLQQSLNTLQNQQDQGSIDD